MCLEVSLCPTPSPGLAPRVEGGSPTHRGEDAGWARRVRSQQDPRSQGQGSGVGTGSDCGTSATFLVVSGTFLRVPPGLPTGPFCSRATGTGQALAFRGALSWGPEPTPRWARSWTAYLMASLGSWAQGAGGAGWTRPGGHTAKRGAPAGGTRVRPAACQAGHGAQNAGPRCELTLTLCPQDSCARRGLASTCLG